VTTTYSELDEDFRYGQLAIEGRLITPDQFDAAMDRVRETKQSLAEILIAESTIDLQTGDRLAKALKRIMRDERAKSEGGMLIKKQIGGYKLIRKIGEGGMGEVYLAEQLTMHRTVALKILHNKWADDEEFRKRFLLEARAAGKLNHQNLIQVYDVGRYQGKYYFSMEFIDGVTVEDLIKHQGSLTIEKVVDIIRQVCEALKYLAHQNIVHRDIKPANIMVTKEGVVKLGDFGFIQSRWDAELMQEGTTIGTPDYISPEQARGERNLDVRSDIYSLGASLFQMLSGKTLFNGTCSAVMRAHIDTEPPRLEDLRKDLPKGMLRLVQKMTRKDQAERYQTPDEVIKDLELLRVDLAVDSGDLPASRSQILNVINAEKDRIATIEEELSGKNLRIWIWMIAAGLGWISAAVMLVLWKMGF